MFLSFVSAALPQNFTETFFFLLFFDLLLRLLEFQHLQQKHFKSFMYFFVFNDLVL